MPDLTLSHDINCTVRIFEVDVGKTEIAMQKFEILTLRYFEHI